MFQHLEYDGFRTVWYWIFLVTIWIWRTHWTLGAPFGMILAAERDPDGTGRDLDRIVQGQARHAAGLSGSVGLALTAAAAFFVAGFATAGVAYGIEIAQAVLVILLPFIFVIWGERRLGQRVLSQALEGGQLRRALIRRRFYNQIWAVASVALAMAIFFVRLAFSSTVLR